MALRHGGSRRPIASGSALGAAPKAHHRLGDSGGWALETADEVSEIARERPHVERAGLSSSDWTGLAQAASNWAGSAVRNRAMPSRMRLLAVPSGTSERWAISSAVRPPQ